MKEQRCKELIREDLQTAAVCCRDLINEIDTTDLTDVDNQLDRIMRNLENAKSQLKGCEDY